MTMMYKRREPTAHEHAAVRWVRPCDFGDYDFAPADLPLLDAVARTD